MSNKCLQRKDDCKPGPQQSRFPVDFVRHLVKGFVGAWMNWVHRPCLSSFFRKQSKQVLEPASPRRSRFTPRPQHVPTGTWESPVCSSEGLWFSEAIRARGGCLSPAGMACVWDTAHLPLKGIRRAGGGAGGSRAYSWRPEGVEVLACKGVGPLQNPGSHFDSGTSTDPSLPSCDCLGLERETTQGYVVLATVMETL